MTRKYLVSLTSSWLIDSNYLWSELHYPSSLVKIVAGGVRNGVGPPPATAG